MMVNDTKEQYQAIVIAAGMGNRLKHYTEETPKCLLEVGGKTILQRQIDIYRECGINKLAVVRGYKSEKINYPGIVYFQNDDYQNNNILNSLFYAEDALNGDVIVSYSDIIFEPWVVERLLTSSHDISLVIDVDWRHTYKGRSHHPVTEAESVVLDANNHVAEIGKIVTSKKDVHGEFIGMLKLSDRGCRILKRHYHHLKKLYWDRPFQRASIFQKAYLTDIFQEMVELGVPLNCVIIERGWQEIDTIQDYELALKEFEE